MGSGGGERGLRGGMRRCEQYYARGDVGEKRGEYGGMGRKGGGLGGLGWGEGRQGS